MPISYESLFLEDAYKLDLLIDRRLMLEIKSVEKITAVHFKQIKTYLKFMNIENGLLLNFNIGLMKEGIHRVFNNFGI